MSQAGSIEPMAEDIDPTGVVLYPSDFHYHKTASYEFYLIGCTLWVGSLVGIVFIAAAVYLFGFTGLEAGVLLGHNDAALFSRKDCAKWKEATVRLLAIKT